MKRILILALATVFGTSFSWSQSLESIKTVVMLGQMDKAKTDFDKAAANPKFMGKAEAYLLKTAIYAGLSMTDQNRNTANGNALVTEADAAFEKYKTLEPEMAKFGEESIYQNGPINIYSNYYNQGLASYNEKKWNEAIPTLKKAISYSDFLIGKKLLPFTLDTNLLILTGVVGERAKNDEVTLSVYLKLASAGVSGPDFEGIYQYLVRSAFQKKDLATFEKIKTQGAGLYPNSDFFKLDRLDFAVGLVDDFNDKLQALNEVIASEPDNYKAHELRWAIIYDTLNSYEEGAVKPSNATELENVMLASMKKCSVIKPQEVKNFLFLGAYYVGRKEAANEARIKFADELQRKTKPGTKALPADIAKRDQLDKDYYQSVEPILDPYLSAAAIYSGKSQLDAREKQQYKNIAGYLAEIYETKKKRAPKDKPAEIAKWTAEEKKWNDVYESIK
jgi:hypothetical protein